MAKLKFVTSNIAAEMIGFSPTHIRRLCKSGKLRAQKTGQDWIILEKDIKRFLQQRESKNKEA